MWLVYLRNAPQKLKQHVIIPRDTFTSRLVNLSESGLGMKHLSRPTHAYSFIFNDISTPGRQFNGSACELPYARNSLNQRCRRRRLRLHAGLFSDQILSLRSSSYVPGKKKHKKEKQRAGRSTLVTLKLRSKRGG